MWRRRSRWGRCARRSGDPAGRRAHHHDRHAHLDRHRVARDRRRGNAGRRHRHRLFRLERVEQPVDRNILCGILAIGLVGMLLDRSSRAWRAPSRIPSKGRGHGVSDASKACPRSFAPPRGGAPFVVFDERALRNRAKASSSASSATRAAARPTILNILAGLGRGERGCRDHGRPRGRRARASIAASCSRGTR